MEIMFISAYINAVIIIVIAVVVMAIYVAGLLLTALLSKKIPYEEGTIADKWAENGTNGTIGFALAIWPVTWILYIIYYLLYHLTYHPIRYGKSIIHNSQRKRDKQKAVKEK